MSQAQTGEKTEKASPQKLRKAREQGQATRSRDIGTAVGLLVSLKLVVWLLPRWMVDFRQLFILALPGGGLDSIGDAASQLFPAMLLLTVKMLLPLLALPTCIALASLFPGGWLWAPQMALPRMQRLQPLENLKRMVTPKHYAQTATLVFKSLLLGAVLAWLLRHDLAAYMRLQGAPLADALRGGARLLLDGVAWLCAVFVLFALVDAPVQRLLFLREQRMSRHDVKEEHKTSEGRPEVKQRIRQLRRLMLRNGIRKAVPGANVVVVNPSHYAVALKYNERQAMAPFVVAKGVDEAALFIRRVAEEHGVEVLSLPPLARAVYHTSQVNQQIPAALYDAVAQALIYVLQIKAFRAGHRRAQPQLPTALDIPAELLKTEPA
ncbi:flagellar type III secretion system protein FlhB [Xanthomonas campestris pv. phormiicola]|nr:flagellar type III secretion system protein FlhB [Xanthomonas campestris pv. phormiicola]UYC17855.1 flagellar type III secretion system protein FlhB [Xanthomonas campestris pv. phormiicola]